MMRAAFSILLWLATACAVCLITWSWWSQGLVYQLISDDLSTTARLTQLKLFFSNFGALAPLVYLVFVTVEVVIAPIPGLMLYAPGGILFGPLVGGGLALAGNVLGAGIACSLTRSLGSTWLSRYFDAEKLERTQGLIEARGGMFLFLLRLNPLTSSDLVSYAAGFTRIPVWKVMTATACGMAPLCFAQAWLAEGLITSFPWLMYPLMAACMAYLVAVILVVRRLRLTQASGSPGE
ncbi:MAG: VTT domain-containing protein [Fuerstiella sp.]